MKRFMQLAGLLAVAAVVGTVFQQPPAYGAPPTLNRGVQAYYFGAILSDSTANTQFSDSFELYEIEGISVQAEYGNITGTLVLEASDDGITFYDCPDVSFTAIAGTGGQLKEIDALRSRYYRFEYTHSSGTGAITIYVHAKGR